MAEPSPWHDAVLAAALLAVDPVGLGGVAVRAAPGPVRDRWLELLRALLPGDAPLRRLPPHTGDGRLLGGLDLAATLRAGRPVAERGLLAEADGGVVVVAMAERLAPATAARLALVLDAGEVRVERDGLALRFPARLGVVALDEGLAEDERLPGALAERLACRVDLDGISARDTLDPTPGPAAILAARGRLPSVRAGEAVLEAICATALALGVASDRAPLLTLRVARAAAALAGRAEVRDADAAVAARLVLASRATMLPGAEPSFAPADPDPPDDPDAERRPEDGEPLSDVVLAAAQAAIPQDLLARLRPGAERSPRAFAPGRAGAQRHAARHGRPLAARSGELRAGARLNLVETLRAAAPWQPLRRRASPGGGSRIEVRREDFRVARFAQRAHTTTIFLVDASGSAAFHRLAEAKGAVELLLAECYVRRDQVALVAFRGQGAEVLLPPTRSLARAKRSLAGLPGGGGTPLAAGLEAAASLAEAARRRGATPTLVLLTDGRANIGRDGSPGRAQAEADALAAARSLRATGLSALLIDNSPRPQAIAERLARELGAFYLPLPYADAAALSRAARSAVAQRPGVAA